MSDQQDGFERRAPDRTADVARVPRVRLSLAMQVSLWLLLVVLLVTGIAWLLAEHATDSLCAVSASACEEPYLWQGWAMRVHGLLAYGLLFFGGMLFAMHLRPAWRTGRNRVTGVLVATVFVLMAVSGYGLYYLVGDDIRIANEWLHWITGFAAPLLVLAHRQAGIQGRNDSR